MTTIQIPIQDDLIRFLGIEKIKLLLEDELAYQRFRLMETDVQKAMNEAKDVDWNNEFEKAKKEAYNQYKENKKY
ncbi:MAG: hypothetical protein A2033_17155 [Bacteroidetes bacterium GWA2_31_9]|nr:MAG: hypothetical protein A2033_17155 [Bacteroidetes bacterium GWA2_31_9]